MISDKSKNIDREKKMNVEQLNVTPRFFCTENLEKKFIDFYIKLKENSMCLYRRFYTWQYKVFTHKEPLYLTYSNQFT